MVGLVHLLAKRDLRRKTIYRLMGGYEAWNMPQKLRSSWQAKSELSSKPLYSPALTPILAKALMNIIR